MAVKKVAGPRGPSESMGTSMASGARYIWVAIPPQSFGGVSG